MCVTWVVGSDSKVCFKVVGNVESVHLLGMMGLFVIFDWIWKLLATCTLRCAECWQYVLRGARRVIALSGDHWRCLL